MKEVLVSSTLKNFAAKFDGTDLPETSSYVEIYNFDRRHVFKKTSVCWLFGKANRKCSSDRRYRVMTTQDQKPVKKQQKIKRLQPYKQRVRYKRKAKY